MLYFSETTRLTRFRYIRLIFVQRLLHSILTGEFTAIIMNRVWQYTEYPGNVLGWCSRAALRALREIFTARYKLNLKYVIK